MFQNAAIDIAIGIILMYLVLSLLCTVVNEYIATKLKMRSENLRMALAGLLDDPAVRTAFYEHGLIAGTMSALKNAATEGKAIDASHADHPSYLSSDTFSLALMGVLFDTVRVKGLATTTFADLEQAIEKMAASKVKSVLQATLIAAEGRLDSFRQSVSSWFDDSMDRLGGVYKRKLKVISIVVGCGVAVALNADTFTVGRALWSDAALRAQMVQAGDKAAKADLPPAGGDPQVKDLVAAYKSADEQLRPLPIGWSSREWSRHRSTGAGGATCFFGWVWFAVTKLAGWFVTGLALSLGAPFWFDLLSKVINLRGAGVRPGRQSGKDVAKAT